MSPAEALAAQQLAAYNARDIDAFMACYHEDVEAWRLPGHEPLFAGHAAMRERYARLFAEHPDLHCHLVQRIVMPPFAMDQEEVQGLRPEGPVHATAIYEVEGAHIRRVWFCRGESAS